MSTIWRGRVPCAAGSMPVRARLSLPTFDTNSLSLSPWPSPSPPISIAAAPRRPAVLRAVLLDHGDVLLPAARWARQRHRRARRAAQRNARRVRPHELVL